MISFRNHFHIWQVACFVYIFTCKKPNYDLQWSVDTQVFIFTLKNVYFLLKFIFPRKHGRSERDQNSFALDPRPETSFIHQPPPPPKNFNTCLVLHFLYFFFELSPTPNKATGVWSTLELAKPLTWWNWFCQQLRVVILCRKHFWSVNWAKVHCHMNKLIASSFVSLYQGPSLVLCVTSYDIDRLRFQWMWLRSLPSQTFSSRIRKKRFKPACPFPKQLQKIALSNSLPAK